MVFTNLWRKYQIFDIISNYICGSICLWDVLYRVWLQGVLPVVSDRESTASEKCLQLLQELVLDGVCKSGASEVTKQLAWSLLRQLMQPDLCELR